MAMFDNLRNFIRQGKQATVTASSSKSQSHNPSPSPSQSTGQHHLQGQSSTSSHQSSNKTLASSSSGAKSGTEARTGAGAGTEAGSPADSASRSSGNGMKNDNGDVDNEPKHETKASSHGGNSRKYDTAVKQLVAEENASRLKLPTYPGLGRYRLEAKMGDGAFSVVYRAHDNVKNEPRAIKVVSKQDMSQSQKSSVLKEAAIMRQLDNKNIVRLYDFIEVSDFYYIVLELVPGGELFHQIVHLTYFSEELSRYVITQVAHAVRYLHEEAGVVHRDIKPENLLFTPVPIKPSKHRVLREGDDNSKQDEGEFTPGVGGGGIGTIKLADFGLSKVIWDNKTMTPCGTVGYTAPEIVKDERYSKSVDMWALGCVLYTILCGFPPFYDESIENLTKKVARGEYTFLSPWWNDISDSAKDLVSHLLTVDPEKRYTIDEFLQHPWITQQPSSAPLTGGNLVKAHTGSITPGDSLEPRDPALSGALKDAFDVSNAVYRMEQEAAEHNPRRNPATIIEEDEEEDEDNNRTVSKNLEGLSISGSRSQPQQNIFSQTAHSQQRRKNQENGFFDLHLEGATLLERRRQAKTGAAQIVI